MAISLLSLLAGVALLYLGGDVLVKGAASLAVRSGLTPLAVGLTVVAFGTSAPELAVSLEAALDQLGDVSLGNIVGSNVSNIALILGLTAIVSPITVHLQVLKFDLPLLIAISLVFMLLLLDHKLGRVEGAGLVIGLIVYIATVMFLSRRENLAIKSEFAEELAEEVRPSKRHVLIDLLLVIVGIGMLVLGGKVFVNGAVDFARWLNVSEAVIALTIVAVGTSLPELATTLVAAMNGHSDIAVGNVVGSNLFNILCIAGITGLVEPISAPDIRVADLAVMAALTLALFPLLKRNGRISRTEGGLLLTFYAGYVTWLATRA